MEENEKPTRIYLVDGKRVAIIKSNTHTYNVRFVKSGIFMEVYKKYVISWFPKPTKKSSTPIPKKPKNSQTSLDF